MIRSIWYTYCMNKWLKYLAMEVFIILPFVGFYLGVQYQKGQEVERKTFEIHTSIDQRPTHHFSWQGIEFDYPEGWEATTTRYASPGMLAQGMPPQEDGFLIFKSGYPSDVNFTIGAGGPQIGGFECSRFRVEFPSVTRCIDIAGKTHQWPFIAIRTSSNDPETIAVFEMISRTGKHWVPPPEGPRG